MALRGWRLFGVAGTILAYVVGILLLSLVSLNSPNQRRPRTGRFGEFDAFRRNEVNMVSKRQPLQWCQPLRYFGQDVQAPSKATTVRPRIRFHALSADYARAPPNEPFQEVFPPSLPDQPPKSKPAPDLNQKRHPQHVANNQKSTVFDDRYVDRDNDINKSKSNIYNEQMHNKSPKDDANDAVRVAYENVWPKKDRLNQKGLSKPIGPNPNDGKDSSESDLIALASFPGSGNTWLRYLLQQSTGFYTGSVYKDFGLLKSGFPGENVFNSSVLVVKTHEWGPKDYAHFSRAILLIRDPDKAILAEFNRQSGGHVGFASPDRYRRTKGRYWQQFVTNKLWAWEQMNTQWAHNFTGAVHIVYYDDLVADVEGTLRSVLKFIRFPINEELLQCAISRKEGIYRRKKRILTFDPYTQEMHVMLETKKRQVYADLGRTKF